MADVIPVFPLSHVLVPGMPLPLHIFEERYRQLLADVTSAPGPACFGVVALQRGADAEVAGTLSPRRDMARIGTLAEIVEVEPYEDGASDLLTVGSRRFRILELIEAGTPYLRAEVDWLLEQDGQLRPGHVQLTRRLCGEMRELLAGLTGRAIAEPLPQDPNLLSYYVAAHLPLDPQDRQALLAEPTAAQRLSRAIGLLRREIRLVQSTRSIAMAPAVLRLLPAAN